MRTRCKVTCDSVTVSDAGRGEVIKSVVFSPVKEGSPENEKFYKWTPGGTFGFEYLSPDVQFEVGKEYYVDITLAESSGHLGQSK